MAALGFRSPPPRSETSTPARPVFDSDLLRAYVKKLLPTTLQNAVWSSERDQVKSWMKEIGERVKERMTEIQPRGFKYIVLVQISEYLGQGGRSAMACHWEDSDICVSELFCNDSIICTCVALAVRTA